MNTEEQEKIDRLLKPKATAAEQKAALKWLADYMEESYILNLPISKAVIGGLEAFSNSRSTDAPARERARKLIKKYKR